MTSTSSPFDEYLQKSLDLLAPIFEPPEEKDARSLFEFVCCLVHPSGVEGLDENPLLETTALIDDLVALASQQLLDGSVDEPRRTRARLALLSYSHVTESDFAYSLLVNLLRVRCGQPWAFAPFVDLARPVNSKKDKQDKKLIQPSPNKKILRLHEYAEKAGFPKLSAALKEIYISEIRNAVFHADYTLTDIDFHMMRDYWLSPMGYGTRDIPIEDLLSIVDRAFAFYYAVLNRHVLARMKFLKFKDKALQFDFRLKGLIEFIFEDELVCGFRVYWPNGQQAQFTRTSQGAHAINIWPSIQGGLSIDVGIYAAQPGPFSPLVETGNAPTYTPARGRTITPYWPDYGQHVELL